MFKTVLLLLAMTICSLGIAAAGEYAPVKLEPPKTAQKAEKAVDQPAATVAEIAKCEDDPRLETDIVEIMESEDPVIVPPLTITAETYVAMEPEVIAKLAGNLVVCPKNPVLKNGKTLRKIGIAFPVLWDQITKAVVAGDEEKLKSLLVNFTSKPMNPREIMTLATTINLDDSKMEMLYKTAGKKLDSYQTPLDFFILTGGKTNENAKIAIFYPSDFKNEDLEKKGKNEKPQYALPARNGAWRNYLADRFKATGLDAENMSQHTSS